MDYNDFLQHWNYFCSLTAQLDDTKDYVYHGFSGDEPGKAQMIHSDVYSDKFKQIIILSASEFELMAKALCNEKGEKTNNIIDISKVLLKYFPKLPETEIISIFCICTPLEGWHFDGNNIVGLEWWKAYNSLKHNEKDSYKKATLHNAFLSVAALYVINLYYMYCVFGSLQTAFHLPPVYFRSKYTSQSVVSSEGTLPDWGNKSSIETIMEKYPELFN